MANITYIKIDGLLDRQESIEYHLDRHTNIFFGENGGGKTTLLRVIDAALSQNPVAITGMPVRRAEVHAYSINRNEIIKHVWERPEGADIKSNRAILHQRDMLENLDPHSASALYAAMSQQFGSKSGWKITSPAKRTASFTLAHTFLPTNRLYSGEVVRRGSSQFQISDIELDRIFSEGINKTWLQFYSATLSKVRKIQEDGLREILLDILAPTQGPSEVAVVDPQIAYKRAKTFLTREHSGRNLKANIIGSLSEFRERYERDTGLQKTVASIDEVEQSIARVFEPVDKFLSTISHLLSRDKQIRLNNNELELTLSSGSTLPLSSLSSGEKHLVRIILSVINAGNTPILIDEPELSLHIDWQREFIKTLRSVNPECQLIMASHSPEVMSNVEDNCIFKI